MMRLTRPTPKRPPETIVALIDVVFFLLVFALLIGRMDATAPFRVTPPEAMNGADLPAGGLTASVSADGAVALNGQPMARNALLSASHRLLEVTPGTRIRINADGATALRHVLPLVEDLKRLGGQNIVLVATPDAS